MPEIARPPNAFVDVRSIVVPVTAEAAFAPIRRIGGDTGWYFGDALWALRGFADRALGGGGIRRGRSDPERLRVGDTVDFWRVEAHEPDAFVRLRAEMKLPGEAWLELRVTDLPEGGARIEQTSIFVPSGLLGRAYWYGVYPLHAAVFGGMLRGIARAAAHGGADRAGPSVDGAEESRGS